MTSCRPLARIFSSLVTADVFKQRLLSFLAKQQHNGSQQTEDDTETAETHDIDVHCVQHTSLHELKDLNMRLSKLVQTQQLRLVELAQLLELLDAMERLMQHGEALLVEHDPQVRLQAFETIGIIKAVTPMVLLARKS